MADFSFTYRAFISYAHADHKWAVWLHRALERYRVPRRLAGAQGLKRLGKCFRDEEELAAAAELGPKIETALKSSDVLIVVCSPRSAQSKWVNQEIEAFKREGREHRVFALIVDGEPHGSPDAAGNPTDCFPEALKRTAAGGPAEPLAVDLRKFGREDAAVRLIAGMLDVGYDDLRQREVRRRRAELFRAQALFVSGLILIAAALTGGYFAASNYVDASERTSRLFAREANSLSREGDYAKAMLMALQGDPAAQSGLVESMLRPQGYEAASDALARAAVANHLLATFTDGEASVTSLAFAPDGKRFVTGSDDGTLRLWQVGEQKPLATFKGHAGPVYSIAFHPDGERFLTGSVDETAKLWRIGVTAPLASFEPRNIVYSVAFNPRDESVLLGCSDEAMLWRIGEDRPLATYAHRGSIGSLAFLPDGERFLTGSNWGSVKLWRIGKAEPEQSFDGGTAILGAGRYYGVNSLALSPDGEGFITGSGAGQNAIQIESGEATLWRLGSDRPARVFARQQSNVASVAFHPDGKRFLTGSDDGTAKLWLTGEDEPLVTFRGHGAAITQVAFDADGKRFLTASRDGAVKLWQVEEMTPLAAFTGDEGMTVDSHPDGDRFVTVARYNERTELRRFGDDKPVATLAGGNEDFFVAFHPDGERYLTSAYAKTSKLWRIGEAKPLAGFTGHNGHILSVAFHPDGQRVLTSSQDGTVKLWRIGEDKPLASIDVGAGDVRSIALHPDGERFLTGAWDGTAGLWKIGEDKPLAVFKGHDGPIYSVAFHPDGERFLTGGDDHTAKLWRIGQEKPLATFVVEKGEVRSVAFHPDGKLVLTGSGDGTAQLWKIGEDTPLVTFRKSEGNGIGVVAFHPNGRQVFTGTATGTNRAMAKQWKIPEIVFASARQRVDETCELLRKTGVTEFSEADYARFPILDRNAPHPCARLWGFDPRAKRASAGPAAVGGAK